MRVLYMRIATINEEHLYINILLQNGIHINMEYTHFDLAICLRP